MEEFTSEQSLEWESDHADYWGKVVSGGGNS